MKATIIALLIFLTAFSQQQTQASSIIDVDYTGLKIEQANDFLRPAASNTGGGPTAQLGGPVQNQFWKLKGSQFTVDSAEFVDYLSIDATAIPNQFIRDNLLSGYIAQRFAEGATIEQIGLEINGDANTPPTFVGPAQSMTVYFSLYDKSAPYCPCPSNRFQPDWNSLVITSDPYTFSTDNSLFTKTFDDVRIPFETKLKPNTTYWLVATDPVYSGVTLGYSTEFWNDKNHPSPHAVPEPATLLLFGGGLWAATRLKKK